MSIPLSSYPDAQEPHRWIAVHRLILAAVRSGRIDRSNLGPMNFGVVGPTCARRVLDASVSSDRSTHVSGPGGIGAHSRVGGRDPVRPSGPTDRPPP